MIDYHNCSNSGRSPQYSVDSTLTWLYSATLKSSWMIYHEALVSIRNSVNFFKASKVLGATSLRDVLSSFVSLSKKCIKRYSKSILIYDGLFLR